MFKKCFTAFLILSVAIGGMAFAGGSSELAVSESGLPIIRVGAQPYYSWVPIQVIEENNLDEQFGFEMEVIDFPSGGPMAEALGAGQWDIGPIGAGGMVAIPNYNARLIGDIESTMDGAWIIARPDSDIVAAGNTVPEYPEMIGSPETTKGKDFLCTFGNISHYMAIDYVLKMGLSLSDVNFIHMETAQVYTAFVSGNGDFACIGSPSAGQRLLQEGYTLVGGLKQQGNPQKDVMVASDDFFTNHKDLCVAFMKAYLTAATMLNDDPDYEVEMTSKFYSRYGRTDFTEESVIEECGWNAYVDLNNFSEQPPIGSWMMELMKCYVDSGTMEESVISALETNTTDEIVVEAVNSLND